MSAPATRPLDHGSAGAGSNLSQKKQAGSVAWNGSNASATRSVATVPGKWSAAVMNDTKGDQPRPTSNVDSTLSMASTNNAASVNGVYRSTVPPVASEPVMRERLLALAVALVGCSVLVRTCHEGRVVGIVSGITLEGGDLGVSLAEAYRLKEGGAAEGPVETLVVWGRDVAEIEAGEVKLATKARDEQGDRPEFRTDVQISAAAIDSGPERSLQRWSDEGIEPIDVKSSALSAESGTWDQFAANEARFGLKSSYNEELYTTKLDRSGANFAAKEKEAARIAAEIIASTTSDSHLAEERGQVDDSGLTEEDKYGAVQRNLNAHVPPAKRNSTSQGGSAKTLAAVSQAAIARSSIDNPISAQSTAAPPSVKKDKNLVYDDFNRFVQKEQSRAAALQHQHARNQKDLRVAELKKWGSTFRLKSPVPSDIAVISNRKAEPLTTEQDASPPTTTTQTTKFSPSPLSRIDEAPNLKGSDDPKYTLAKMTIPKIPPFNPEKARSKADTEKQDNSSSLSADTQASSIASLKMSAKASAFKPFNPGAAVFKPSQAPQSAESPKEAPPSDEIDTGSVDSNPFFGSREPLRQTGVTPVNVFTEFSPLRAARKGDPTLIGPLWPFSGRPFRVIFAPSVPPPNLSAAFISAPLPTSESSISRSPVPAPAQPGHTMPMQNPGFMMPGTGTVGQPPYGFAYPPMGAPYRFPPPDGQPFQAAHHMSMPSFYPHGAFSPQMIAPANSFSPHLANAIPSPASPYGVGPGATLQGRHNLNSPGASHLKAGQSTPHAGAPIPRRPSQPSKE